MDSLNSNGPGALALEPLCQGAAQELLMRSYTIRTVNRYKRVWKQLADFVRAQGLPAEYTRELALRFEQAYGVRDGEVLKLGQQWRRHLVFGIKVLDDFARTGTISRFVVETTGLRVPAGMHKPLREYEQYARERRHLRPTSLAERMHNIAVFLDFLRTRGLERLDTLQAEHLSAFVQTRTDWKPRTVACVSSSVRLFLQFLFMRGALPRDLDAASLHLGPAGQALLRALQDYGAYDVDSAGDYSLYAEPAAEGELGSARKDWVKLRPLLRCVTNNRPDAIGGPGPRVAPPALPLAPLLSP